MNKYAHFEQNRTSVETGVFLALFWGLGYAFLYVPNVEFILFVAFLSGVFLGWTRGLFVALVGEGVFSIANPMGSGLAYPPMLIAQLLSFGIIASVGYGFRPILRKNKNKKKSLIVIMGLTGFLLTFLYDSLTSLAFPLASGFKGAQIWAVYLSGLPFYGIHILSNTLIFSLLGSFLIQFVDKKYPHYLREET